MKVHVTAKDIREGVRGSACDCPVAVALHRHKAFMDVAVRWSGIWLRGLWLMPLPVRALQFLRRFDRSKPVKPFTFELKLK